MPDIGSWRDVEDTLNAEPAGAVLRLPKRWLPHPTYDGLGRTYGFPDGQMADYDKPLLCGGRLFVREFPEWYEVHREEHPPRLPAVRPNAAPSPAATIAGAAALGAIFGSVIGDSSKATMAGAAIGGVLAAALLAQQS